MSEITNGYPDYSCVSGPWARGGRKPHRLPPYLPTLLGSLSIGVSPSCSCPRLPPCQSHRLCPFLPRHALSCIVSGLHPLSPASSHSPTLLEPWLNSRLSVDKSKPALNAWLPLASLPAPLCSAVCGRVSALPSDPHSGLLGTTGVQPLSSLQLLPQVWWARVHSLLAVWPRVGA